MFLQDKLVNNYAMTVIHLNILSLMEHKTIWKLSRRRYMVFCNHIPNGKNINALEISIRNPSFLPEFEIQQLTPL